ncbi:MAG: hypothetical protein WCK31_02960 [bacterium]
MEELLAKNDPDYYIRWQVENYHFPPSLLFGAKVLSTEEILDRHFTYCAISKILRTSLMSALSFTNKVYPSVVVINEKQLAMKVSDPKYISIEELARGTLELHTECLRHEESPFNKNASVTFLHESNFPSSTRDNFISLREIAKRYVYAYVHDNILSMTYHDKRQEIMYLRSQKIANCLVNLSGIIKKDNYPIIVTN